jgi:hypothetical protein
MALAPAVPLAVRISTLDDIAMENNEQADNFTVALQEQWLCLTHPTPRDAYDESVKVPIARYKSGGVANLLMERPKQLFANQAEAVEWGNVQYVDKVIALNNMKQEHQGSNPDGRAEKESQFIDMLYGLESVWGEECTRDDLAAIFGLHKPLGTRGSFSLIFGATPLQSGRSRFHLVVWCHDLDAQTVKTMSTVRKLMGSDWCVPAWGGCAAKGAGKVKLCRLLLHELGGTFCSQLVVCQKQSKIAKSKGDKMAEKLYTKDEMQSTLAEMLEIATAEKVTAREVDLMQFINGELGRGFESPVFRLITLLNFSKASLVKHLDDRLSCGATGASFNTVEHWGLDCPDNFQLPPAMKVMEAEIFTEGYADFDRSKGVLISGPYKCGKTNWCRFAAGKMTQVLVKEGGQANQHVKPGWFESNTEEGFGPKNIDAFHPLVLDDPVLLDGDNLKGHGQWNQARFLAWLDCTSRKMTVRRNAAGVSMEGVPNFITTNLRVEELQKLMGTADPVKIRELWGAVTEKAHVCDLYAMNERAPFPRSAHYGPNYPATIMTPKGELQVMKKVGSLKHKRAPDVDGNAVTEETVATFVGSRLLSSSSKINMPFSPASAATILRGDSLQGSPLKRLKMTMAELFNSAAGTSSASSTDPPALPGQVAS